MLLDGWTYVHFEINYGKENQEEEINWTNHSRKCCLFLFFFCYLELALTSISSFLADNLRKREKKCTFQYKTLSKNSLSPDHQFIKLIKHRRSFEFLIIFSISDYQKYLVSQSTNQRNLALLNKSTCPLKSNKYIYHSIPFMSTLKLYVAASSCKRSEKIPHVDFSQNLNTLILTHFCLFGLKYPEQNLFFFLKKKKKSIWLSSTFSQKITNFLQVVLEKNSG